MRSCNKCKYPIIPAMCVPFHENICFNCGSCYEFFNDCEEVKETKELLEKKKKMEEIKEKVYAIGFERKEDGSCKGINQEELIKRIKNEN